MTGKARTVKFCALMALIFTVAVSASAASLGTTSILVGSASGTSSVVLSANASWTATSNSSFLHVSSGSASGTTSAVVVFTYDAYTGAGTRTGTLTIAGLTLTVTQAGTNYEAATGATTVVSSGLGSPATVAVDGSGNLYIADNSNNAIYKWTSSTQALSTLVPSSSGLVTAFGVAVDGQGNLFVTNSDGGGLQEWTASNQTLTTLRTNGFTFLGGDSVDSAENVYLVVSTASSSAIKKYATSSQQLTSLVSSGLNNPFGAAVDAAGNVFFGDTGNNQVKEWVNAATPSVVVLASSAQGLSGPDGVAVDGLGNLYIADNNNNAVKEWSAGTQTVSTLVGSGLQGPYGTAVDGSGNVYFVDSGTNTVKEIPYAFVGPSGGLTEGPGSGSDALLQALPSTAPLSGVFAPKSDQTWLTIGTVSVGIVNFSFTANNTGSARVAHIAVLGRSITVTQDATQLSQTISFGSLADQVYGASPFAVSATASSNLAVSFASTTTSICSVSGSTVTLLSAGLCTVQASQAGNGLYMAAASVSQSFNVTQASQTISFGPLSNVGLAASPLTLGASASSGLAVTFASNTTSVCTVSGVTATLLTAGTCTIVASQAGNTDYAAATPVSQSFTVSASGPVLGTSSLLVGSAAGTSSVELSDPNSWTAVSNSSFLHVTSGSASGASSAVVAFSYDANTGAAARTGTLTIAGLTLTVTQAGASYAWPASAVTVASGLNTPAASAVDSAGNIYIADSGANSIKKWTASTQQTTTLVTGLNAPLGVAVDSSGNVYIADTNTGGTNGAIKEWNASTQQVSTLVSGLNYPVGVAVDRSGNVYFSDSDNNAVKEWAASTQQVSTLVSSGLNFPLGVAVDAIGNVYIADASNSAVKEWNAATQQVTTLISAGLPNPRGIAVDGSGNLYISDVNLSAVDVWNAVSQQISTLVSSGLSGPRRVAVDGSGNVYITDSGNDAIKEVPLAYVGPAAGLTETAPGGSDALPAVIPSSTPLTGVFAPSSDQSWLTIGAIAGGVVNFAFSGNTTTSSRVAHIGILGQSIAVTQNGLLAQSITFNSLPDKAYGTANFTVSANASSSLAVSFSSNTPAVCSVSSNTVTILAAGQCTIVASQAGNSSYAAAASVPQSFTVQQAPQTITFGALVNALVGAPSFPVSANASSGLAVSFSSATSGVCSVSGNSVSLLAAGLCSIVAAQAGNANYQAAPSVTQSFLAVASTSLGTSSMAVGSAAGSSSVVLFTGNSWTASANDSFLHVSAGSASGTGSQVVAFTYDAYTGTGTRTGTLTIAGLTLTVTQAGTNYTAANTVGTLISSTLVGPETLAVDASGNVYVADSTLNLIDKWTAATQQVTHPLTGLSSPFGVAVDALGNLYISESGISTIQEYSAATQQLTNVTSSGLRNIGGLGVDSLGNLYVVNNANSIREWNVATQTGGAIASSLNSPFSVSVDSAGDVYFADTGNNAVKEWNAASKTVSTVVSTGLNSPYGVAVDGSGNLYIADGGSSAIKEWNASTQTVNTLLSSGISSPYGTAVDGSGDVFFIDGGNNAVKEIPYALVPTGGLTEGSAGGSDALAQVLPAAAPLTGVFAPTSDQSWLTIGTVSGGEVNFSFTANTGGSSRVAHITVLGQQITVTQTSGATLLSQTITFGTLPNVPYGTPAFAVSASASSGLAVSFASTTLSVCSVSGNMVTPLTLGTCTIQASQAGNGMYAAAPNVSQSFSVTQAPQTITFGALSDQVYGSAAFTVSATASSNLAVSFASTTLSICTVSGSTVTLLAVGSCAIQATQAGNTNYAAATPVSQSFNVTAAAQTITFGSLANQIYGSGSISLSATTTSGLTVAFASTTPAVCGVSVTTVSLLGLGLCTIQASQSGNTDYAAATSVSQSFSVLAPTALGLTSVLVGSGGGASSVLLTDGGAWTAVANDGFLHVSPGSASGAGDALVQFSYDAFAGAGSRTGTLTIAGLTLTVTQAGANYLSPGPLTALTAAGISAPGSVAVDAAGNVYIADTGNGAIKEWTAATQQVSTLVSSGLSAPAGVAVDAAGNVYIADTGNNAIKEWNASTEQVSTLVGAGLSAPAGVAVDSFGNVYVADSGNNAVKEWTAATQQVSALVSGGLTAPSGVAVDAAGNLYIADTGNSAIKQWNAATQQVSSLVSTGLSDPAGVAVDGSGNVYIADTQDSAIEEWTAATQQVSALVSSGIQKAAAVAVDRLGNVYIADTQNGAVREIPNVFTGPANLTETATGGTDALLPTLPATAPLTGVFAPTSDQPWLSIGSIAGGVVNFSFAANSAGSPQVAHIAILGQRITVTQNALALPQTISFSALSDVAFSNSGLTLSASSSSGLVVAFASNTQAVCAVSGTTVTLAGVGQCSITASQPGNATYAAAAPVTQSFNVSQGSQTITFGALSDLTLAATPFAVSATATSGLPVSFASNTALVCTVSANTVTLVGPGSCSVTASQSGNANFAAAAPVTQGFNVTLAPQTITFGALPGVVAGAAPFTLTATASSGLAVAFASNATAVCTVSGATVTIVATGQCWITASQTGNADYQAAVPVAQSFTVSGQPLLGASGALVAAGGGTSSVIVTYNGNWTAVSNAAFVHVLAGSASGTGNGLVALTYDSNLTAATRTGTVTVEDPAAPAGAATFTLTEAGQGYEALGGLVRTAANAAVLAQGCTPGPHSSFNGTLYCVQPSQGAVLSIQGDPTVTTLISSGLSNPSGLAVDASGNIYIADTGNNAVKEWSAATQQVSTLVSAGLSGPKGLDVDAFGNVYIADTGHNAIEEWSPAAQQLIPLVASGLSSPSGVTVDASGNLYITDHGNNALKEWNAATRQVTLLSSALNNPSAAAVDGAGDVYIADTGNNAIERWIAATAQLNTPVSSLSGPTGVTVDGADDIFVGDAGNNQLEEYPNAFVGPAAGLTEGPGTGSDSLLPVLPAATDLGGVFAPASDSGWLNIGTVVNGVVNFSFAANTTGSPRSGNIKILGAQIPVMQNGALEPQTITLGPLSDEPFGSAAFAVSATATSGLAVTFSSLTTAACTVSGNMVTLAAVGSCTIAADQAGNALYAAAAEVTQSFQVTQGSQSITFAPLSNVIVGSPAFSIAATASSGLSVAFASTTPSVCTVSGNTVTLLILGTCSIQASQAGDTNWVAAAPVTQSFNVTPPGVSISGQVTLASSGLSGVTITLSGSASASATTDSNGNYSFASLPAAGNYTVTPSLAGDAFNPIAASFSNLSSDQTANFAASAAVGSVTAVSEPAGSGAPANLNTAPTTLTAPAAFHLPVSIALNGGASVDTLSFGLQISPNGGAPALTGALTFTQAAALAAPSVSGGSSGSIDLSWTGLGTPVAASQALGVLSGTIPAGAQVGQTYTVTVTVTDAANTGGAVPVGVIAGPAGTLTVALTYMAGDVAPSNSDTVTNFGDGTLDIRDLIQELFAVNNLPGYRPAACSDRFDAMDLYPADTATARGGDNTLDIRDLILELFRVNNLDPARPVRASRGGACASTGSVGSAAAPGRMDAESRPLREADGSLALGSPELAPGNTARIPVYLQATRDLRDAALTFAAGDLQSPLRFVSIPVLAPGLIHDSEPGVAAVVWPNGISVPARGRVLLGYIAGAADALANIRIFGSSASTPDGQAIRLESGPALAQ